MTKQLLLLALVGASLFSTASYAEENEEYNEETRNNLLNSISTKEHIKSY